MFNKFIPFVVTGLLTTTIITVIAGIDKAHGETSQLETRRSIIVGAPSTDLKASTGLIDRYALQLQIEMDALPIEVPQTPLDADFLYRRWLALTSSKENKTEAVLEVGVIPGFEGRLDLYLKGNGGIAERQMVDAKKSLISIVEREITIMEHPEPDALAYQMYHLSYLQADRAIALLKALGYSTIEYATGPGDSLFDKYYNPRQSGGWKLPVIVKLPDSTKTSLMDKLPGAVTRQQAQKFDQRSSQYTAVPDIGGTYLHHSTSGDPQQRLLLVYDKNNPKAVAKLLTLLREQIDRPARQIIIEALVIEVSTEKLSNLGLDIVASEGKFSTDFSRSLDGSTEPFTFSFTDSGYEASDYLQLRLNALVASGDAEILSSPSVLVLDGRQARIQIGQQVPVVKSTATNAGIISAVDYFPVGIVLNLRPRLNEDGSDVTMQVETIVSSISQNPSSNQEVFVAPTIDNRQVQTFVRVGDNTPFIIGGLISTDSRDVVSRVPLLSKIPIFGRVFTRKNHDQIKKEVIIVLTPHVMPLDEKSFSYLLPQDSDAFNSFGNILFRNAYRIKADDVFDLRFVYDSDYYRKERTRLESAISLTADLSQRILLEGLKDQVPGEEILVRRMIWEIVHKTEFTDHIPIDRIILFKNAPDAANESGFTTEILSNHWQPGTSDILISIDLQRESTPEHPFVQPLATLESLDINITSSEFFTRQLIKANPRNESGIPLRASILLSDVQLSGNRGASSLEVLQGVLVMKKVLALNKGMPLTLKAFREGRQIMFPSAEDLANSYHLIDRDVARYYYEVIQYYPEFERAFRRELAARGNSLITSN